MNKHKIEKKLRPKDIEAQKQTHIRTWSHFPVSEGDKRMSENDGGEWCLLLKTTNLKKKNCSFF